MDLGLVVASFDRAEGTGGYVVELTSRLAPVLRVTLYAAEIRSPVPEGVRVVRVPALRGRAYATILSFPAAFAAVRRPHDVVHAQGWTAMSADVVTAHIVLAAWRAAVRRAGGPHATGERLFGGVVEAAERRLLGRRARLVIAPSEQAKADLARHYGRSSGVAVIPHGFPTPAPPPDRRAARRRLGIGDEGFLALYAGDIRKGLEVALRASHQAGTGLLVASRSSHAAFRATVQRCGGEERTYWLGALPDLATAYAAADVLLHPTIYDTFGLVVAEAMARGLPPVVSRAAGIAELVRHGEAGWLLGDDFFADARLALTTLAREPALVRRLGDGARAVAARRTWDDVARETLAAYERVAGGRA